MSLISVHTSLLHHTTHFDCPNVCFHHPTMHVAICHRILLNFARLRATPCVFGVHMAPMSSVRHCLPICTGSSPVIKLKPAYNVNFIYPAVPRKVLSNFFSNLLSCDVSIMYFITLSCCLTFIILLHRLNWILWI